MKTPTKAAAHCVYNLNYHIVNYHIVLVTKYRNRVLTGDIERFVKEQVPLICARYESSALGTSHLRSVRVICARYEWETLALEVMPEHVHLFVSAGPLTAPNTIAKTVKSILQEHPGRRRVPRVPDAQGASVLGQRPLVGRVLLRLGGGRLRRDHQMLHREPERRLRQR